MRAAPVAWLALAVAPVPIVVALIVTAKPVYPPDACYYGAPRSAQRSTDDYLALMVPLATFGLAAAATVVCWLRLRRWRLAAAALLAWAALCTAWQPASHPVMYPYGVVAIFGIFLTPPLLVVVAAAARQSAWLRALAWFEAIYLLPILLGLSKVLAQPPCIS